MEYWNSGRMEWSAAIMCGTASKLRQAIIVIAGLASLGPVCAQTGTTNPPALAYEEPRFLTGTIYAKGLERTNVLFRFTRTATRSGNTLKVLREFTQPDGKPAARERVLYEG